MPASASCIHSKQVHKHPPKTTKAKQSWTICFICVLLLFSRRVFFFCSLRSREKMRGLISFSVFPNAGLFWVGRLRFHSNRLYQHKKYALSFSVPWDCRNSWRRSKSNASTSLSRAFHKKAMNRKNDKSRAGQMLTSRTMSRNPRLF